MRRPAGFPARRASNRRGPTATLLLGLATLLGSLLGTAPACRRSSPGSGDARLEGSVATRSGAAVSDATLELHPAGRPAENSKPSLSARTDAQGRFSQTIRGVEPGEYEVRVSAPSHALARVPVRLAPPQSTKLKIQLDPAAPLAGRIRDARQQPVPLARVLAFSIDGTSSPTPAEARADEEGRFVIADLPAGRYRLLIEAPGLGSATAAPVVAPDSDVVVTLSGESRTIGGRVLSAGQAFARAGVTLVGEALDEPRLTTTDEQGRFVFFGIGPGTYGIRAEAPGLASPVVRDVTVDEAVPPPSRIELALESAAASSGRVVDESGAGVPEAEVELDAVPAAGLWPTIMTDDHGQWTSPPLPPGTYVVRARKRGFVPKGTVTFQVPARGAAPSGAENQGQRQERAAIKLELSRAGRVVGKVTDHRGLPLAGAAVRDLLVEAEELGVIWSTLPPAAAAAARPAGLGSSWSATPVGPGTRRTVTDRNGFFQLDDVPPGPVRLEILPAGAAPLRTAAVSVGVGQRLDLGTLRVPASKSVSGRVLDAAGAPVGGAQVTATRERAAAAASAAADVAQTTTPPSGEFVLTLPSGTYRVIVTAPGHTSGALPVVVSDAAGAVGPPPLTFRLARRDLSLEGLVRDTHGRPVARATVTIRAASEENGPPAEAGASPAPSAAPAQPLERTNASHDAESIATALTDAGGHFRVAGVPSGRLAIEVRHPSYPLHRRTVTPSGLVVLDVAVPGGVDGSVHERSTGAPIRQYAIRGRGPDGATVALERGGSRRRTTEETWRFSLRQIQPGPWALRVEADGFLPLERNVDVPSASFPGEPSVRDLRLELQRDDGSRADVRR